MAYTRVNWEDLPSTNTPRNATNLNIMDAGIDDADTRIDNLSTGITNLGTRLDTAEIEIDNLQTGWNSAGETWVYSSVDDPTGVITIAGDVTTKYSLGMRIKFTNGGNVIYGIITAISYSSPNTTLTFLHEINPSNSLAKNLMQNSTITNNYYSHMKAPYGFPLNHDNWTVFIKDTITRNQVSPSPNVWYNLGSTFKTVPIGLWEPSYKVLCAVTVSSAKTATQYVTLSVNNNGESEGRNTIKFGAYCINENDFQCIGAELPELNLNVATDYYLNSKTDISTGITNIYFLNDQSTLLLKFKCVYL